jgi:hypothetical protein
MLNSGVLFFFLFGYLESLLLSIMAFACLVAIGQPLNYSIIMSPCICSLLILVSFSISVLDSLVHCLMVIRTAPCHHSAAWAAAGFVPCRTKPTVPYLCHLPLPAPRPCFSSWCHPLQNKASLSLISCHLSLSIPSPCLLKARPTERSCCTIFFFSASQPAYLTFGHELPLVSGVWHFPNRWYHNLLSVHM